MPSESLLLAVEVGLQLLSVSPARNNMHVRTDSVSIEPLLTLRAFGVVAGRIDLASLASCLSVIGAFQLQLVL